MRRKFGLVILLHIGLLTHPKAQPADTVLIRQFTHSNYNADITNFNGLGVAAEPMDKIFDMFYRASEKYEGSGLGLYIVKVS